MVCAAHLLWLAGRAVLALTPAIDKRKLVRCQQLPNTGSKQKWMTTLQQCALLKIRFRSMAVVKACVQSPASTGCRPQHAAQQVRFMLL